MYNANYIVTNSFHGIAFSLRFRKQFIPLKRGKYNNRIESILRLVNLEDRLLMHENNIYNSEIDYERNVDQIIGKMEEQSKQYLQRFMK